MPYPLGHNGSKTSLTPAQYKTTLKLDVLINASYYRLSIKFTYERIRYEISFDRRVEEQSSA